MCSSLTVHEHEPARECAKQHGCQLAGSPDEVRVSWWGQWLMAVVQTVRVCVMVVTMANVCGAVGV